MKNKGVILSIFIAAIAIIAITLLCIYFNGGFNNILYMESYENHAWSSTNYGYFITYNGIIKEFDKYDKDRKLKSAKISKEELNQLINLADLVIDDYRPDTSGLYMADYGVHTTKVYSRSLSTWIILSKFGDSNGSNNTERSKMIQELASELYTKYLGQN